MSVVYADHWSVFLEGVSVFHCLPVPEYWPVFLIGISVLLHCLVCLLSDYWSVFLDGVSLLWHCLVVSDY